LAIPEAVKKAGLALNDIDLFEINEAFASQFSYCAEQLGLNMDKVNVNRGAIALGHPPGCTGNLEPFSNLFRSMLSFVTLLRREAYHIFAVRNEKKAQPLRCSKHVYR